jgi:heme O synthase-like polyprenyltransferase
MRLFWFSILYLFVLFGFLVVERGFGLFERWGL